MQGIRLAAATILQRFPVVVKPEASAVAAYKAVKAGKAGAVRKRFPDEVYADRRSMGGDEGKGGTFWDRYEGAEAGEGSVEDVVGAAESGELRNTSRALDESLFLLLKKDREEHAWQFPQGGWEEGETMRQAAERELGEEIGEEAPVYFVSNAPSAHVEYQGQGDPTRLFFYRAWYLGDNGEDVVLPENEGIVEYAWVTKDEAKILVSPDVFDVVEPLL